MISGRHRAAYRSTFDKHSERVRAGRRRRTGDSHVIDLAQRTILVRVRSARSRDETEGISDRWRATFARYSSE